MMKFKINILSLILFFLIISAAQAQVTVDVSKITCEQFRGYAITDPNNIALWLSGYYNGQRYNWLAFRREGQRAQRSFGLLHLCAVVQRLGPMTYWRTERARSTATGRAFHDGWGTEYDKGLFTYDDRARRICWGGPASIRG